jgi:chemotaxis phosphatase CheX-like protein
MRPDTDLPDASEISELVDQAFSTLDGMEAQPCQPYEPGPGAADLTALVGMTGGFEGAVTLHCPRRLVERLVSAMLAAPIDDISDEAASDAFVELAHIVAGNVKSLIAVPPGGAACVLRGGEVQNGVLDLPGATSRREAYFRCGDDRFWLRLWELREPR